jgi:thiol-disulfide isomerase/thioredoxin
MNKDGEVMKNMQKKYKFLGDKSKIYQYELDGEN